MSSRRGCRFATAVVVAALALGPAGRARAGAPSAAAAREIVLGLTAEVDVTFRVAERPGDEARPLRVASSAGAFEAPVRVAPGVYRALYRPPATLFPQVALVAAWRDGGPDEPLELLRLPLKGRTRLPVEAAPGTQISVRCDDYAFGPVVVGPSGLEQVPLVIRPGVPEAEVVARDREGRLSRRRLPVQVPEHNQLLAVVRPHALRADGRSQARLEVFFHEAETRSADEIQVAASQGTLALAATAPGHLSFAYTPPEAPGAAVADLQVTVRGRPSSRASLQVALSLPRPTRLVLRAPPAPVVTDGRGLVRVEVRLFDEEGLGLAAHPVRLSAAGADVPLEDAGGGLYRALFRAPLRMPASRTLALEARLEGAVALSDRAEVALAPSAVPASLKLAGGPSLLSADGRAGPRLRFEVRDSSGRPVIGALLHARLSHGGAGAVRELGGGLYETSLRAPSEPPPGGEVELRVADVRGAMEEALAIPVRADPGRFLLGLRVGYFHSLAALHGPRAGLGAGLRLGPVLLEVLGTVAEARQRVAGAGLSSESRALVVPLALRGAWELFADRSWSVSAGVGALASWARVSNDLTGAESSVGFGALAYASAAYQLGPGQAFVDLSYAWAPVRGRTFQLQSGGLGLEAGYRLKVF